MSGKEQDFIKEAFDTNWVVPLGPNVNGFEKDLENFVNKVTSDPHCALNNDHESSGNCALRITH